MKQEQVATSAVEAQDNCALQEPIAFAGMGSIEQQPSFRPITRRDLMAAVNTVSKDLGLRAASVMVIDALLSCLPCKDSKSGLDRPISPLTLLTVYASNNTLCFRAKGITERQLRRHLERLEEVGLIQRKDSANGKRFPIHRGGKVIGAFGIDLSPLLARAEELFALAQKRRQEADELRGLRSYIQKLRMECLRLPVGEDVSTFLEGTRNIMRRASTTLVQARAIVDKLTDVLMGVDQANTEGTQAPVATIESKTTTINQPQQNLDDTTTMTATDGRNVRHKEPQKSYTKKTTPASNTEFWNSLTVLSEFYPSTPRTERAMVQIIFEFGKMLRIAQVTLTKAISTIGYAKTLMVQNQIAGSAEQISNPDAYLARIISATKHTLVGHGQLSNPA